MVLYAKTRHRTVSAVGIGFIVLLLISACSSLPLPDSPKQGLLVVNTVLDMNERGRNTKLNQIILELRRAGSQEPIMYTLRRNDDMITIALDEGEYTFTRAILYHQDVDDSDNTWKINVDLNRSFYMERRIIRLFDDNLIVRYAGSDGSYLLYFAEIQTDAKKTDVYRKLTKDPRWRGWDRYTLINFPDEVRETE